MSLLIGDEKKCWQNEEDIAGGDHQSVAQGRSDIDIVWWDKSKDDGEGCADEPKKTHDAEAKFAPWNFKCPLEVLRAELIDREKHENVHKHVKAVAECCQKPVKGIHCRQEEQNGAKEGH